MATYRLKRVLRDFVARRSPTFYEHRVSSMTSSVPSLDIRGESSAMTMARSVAAFYCGEYINRIDDASVGRFTLLNRTVDFGNVNNVDWHHSLSEETDFHLWRQKLAHMGFMCPMLVHGNGKHLLTVRSLIRSFNMQSNFSTPGCFSSFWFPYSVSHRILAILSGYIIALNERKLPDIVSGDVESFLKRNVGFLLMNIEHDLRNNHVERNLAALCFYFSCVSAPPTKISRRLDREVLKIMEACILSDGFSIERSSMYQGLSVMALEIFATARCLSPETRITAQALHASAARAWNVMTHPDGDIALFNDSWIGEVPRAGDVTSPYEFGAVEVLRSAGYARLQSGAAFAIMDAGPIGPRWCPGHGHADFLAVEMDFFGKRFIVDPGTFQYSTGPRRAFERSATSHNGPTRLGLQPVEYTGCFRVGRMSEAKLVETTMTESGGSVRGRLELGDGSAVERTLNVDPDTFEVVDQWFGGSANAFVRLIVSDEWSLTRRRPHSIVFSAGDTAVELLVIEGCIGAVELGEWSSRYLESEPATAITLSPLAGPHGLRAVWKVQVLE